MKIVAINGSPRNGNTDVMIETVLSAAQSKGAVVEYIKLREKSIKFCSGGDNCCPVNLKCHIKDDMPQIEKSLEEADVIILATPAYFSNVTARMKNFMDRCNPYWFNKKLKGKKVYLLGVGGVQKSVDEMLTIMKTFLRILEIECLGSFGVKADKIGEIKNNSEALKRLKEIGRQLV